MLRGAPDVGRETWIRNAVAMCWGSQYEISDFAVRGHAGDTAIVSLVLTTYEDPATCEPAIIRSLLTDVWIRQPNGWRLVLRHSGPGWPNRHLHQGKCACGQPITFRCLNGRTTPIHV